MTQTLASDMARKSLTVFLERAEGQSVFSAEEAKEFLSGCEITNVILEKNWLLIQALIDRGVEGRKFAFLAKEGVDVLELAIKGLDVARAKISAADLATEEKTAGISTLEAAGRRAVAMRDELLKLLRWVETPPRPIDIASLPTGRDDPNVPGYIDMDEFLAEFVSGNKP